MTYKAMALSLFYKPVHGGTNVGAGKETGTAAGAAGEELCV